MGQGFGGEKRGEPGSFTVELSQAAMSRFVRNTPHLWAFCVTYVSLSLLQSAAVSDGGKRKLWGGGGGLSVLRKELKFPN